MATSMLSRFTPDWCKKCLFWSPSLAPTLLHSRIANFEVFRKSRKTTGNFTDRDNNVIASVSRLFFGRRPLAVTWFVVSVVVDALKRFSFRFFTHVLKEVRKDFPSFAYRYSTSSVIGIIYSVFTLASFNHAAPSNRSSTGLGTCKVTVSSIAKLNAFHHEAAARLCMSASQFIIGDRCKVTTYTPADTVGAFRYRNDRIRKHNKPSKCFSDDVYFRRHGVTSFIDAVLSSGRSAVTGAHYEFIFESILRQ